MLRGGGGSNFGIVTRSDLATFEKGILWGSTRLSAIQYNDSLITAFHNFVNKAPTDHFAHLYLVFMYIPAFSSIVCISQPVYGTPISNPPIFDEFNAIPSLVDGTRITNMSTLAAELTQPEFHRQMFRTLTFKNHHNAPELMTKILAIYIEETKPLIQRNISGLVASLVFQPWTINIIEQMQKNGGNALGIHAVEGPLIIQNMQWALGQSRG